MSLGFDISSVSVENAREASKEYDNVRFFQADAENTQLPDNSIDRVICSGMLHHLDLSYAFPELRDFKPGGKFGCKALNYNPAISSIECYTVDENGMGESYVKPKRYYFCKRFFHVENMKYWHVSGCIGGKFPFMKTR